MGKIVLGAGLTALILLATACRSESRPAAVPPSVTGPPSVTVPGEVVALADLPPLGASSENVDDLVGAVHAYEAEHGDVCAGVLLAGGRVWVGFIRDAATHLAMLRARVERPHLLAAFTAEYSERELRALQARITADITVLKQRGVSVSTVGFDVQRNRVGIGVRDAAGDRVRALLARRYDERLFSVETGVDARPVTASGRP